jgi:hypothetical protein
VFVLRSLFAASCSLLVFYFLPSIKIWYAVGVLTKKKKFNRVVVALLKLLFDVVIMVSANRIFLIPSLVKFLLGGKKMMFCVVFYAAVAVTCE